MKSSASGKFVVRMESSFHHQLRGEASAQGVSLNQLVVNKLKKNPEESDVLAKIQSLWGKSLLAVVKFGSQVRGEATLTSDIDLLLVLEHSVPVERALYDQWEDGMGVHLDQWSPQFVHLPSQVFAAGGLWFEVGLEGELLWERDLRVRRFMLQIKRAIAEGKIQRKTVQAQSYWVKHEK